ncbi:unnamed protein product [Ilex paraguariensis]|uniref:DUF4378 domain-containing protein n=1 Tax=Ilex paraguariensis TaxID=185542 RepID=A0ABC8SV38_9AQUA
MDGSFPSADCRVLEDIDALIDKDLFRNQLQNSIALEEEAKVLVSEIEDHIVDTLVHEMAHGSV